MPDRDEFFQVRGKCRAIADRIADRMLSDGGGERHALTQALGHLLKHIDGFEALRSLGSGSLSLPFLEQTGHRIIEPWIHRARLQLGPQADPLAVIAEVCRSLLLSQVVDAREGVLERIRQLGRHPWHFDVQINKDVAHVSREAAPLIADGKALGSLRYPKSNPIDHRSGNIDP